MRVSDDQLIALFRSATNINSADELWEYFAEFCVRLGFLHIRLSVFPLHATIDPKNFLYLKARDETVGKWGEYYLRERMYEYDQSIHLVRRLGVEALKWSEMAALTRKGSRANHVFVEARRFGVPEGLLVPHSSLLSRHTAFMGIAGPETVLKPFSRAQLKSFIWTVHIVIDRIIDLAKKEGTIDPPPIPPVLKITDRQREVLYALSVGETYDEAAEHLNGSRDALRKIVERLKNRTGTKNIASLVAYALRHRLIH